MKTMRVAVLALMLGPAAWPAGDIVAAVRAAVASGNFTQAEREIQRYRGSSGATPEMMEALSWMARDALAAKQYDRADRYALETQKLSEEALRRSGRVSSPAPPLDIALGAAIEVHGQVLAARGARAEAVAFLVKQLATYRKSPLAPRIQKNINLLTLEGKQAPPLDVSRWVGAKPVSLVGLKGHPVLLFFWAHWCGDCKAEVPVLARLMEDFGRGGLVVVGPTQLYGYAAGGEDAPADKETRYIEQIRTQYYGSLRSMPVPLSAENFQRYGCSTTPTLVLLDRAGVVRLYHPGAMPYEALALQVNRILGPAQGIRTTRP